jgi:hypothetical protein
MSYSKAVIPKLFFSDRLKIAEGLSGPLHYFSTCCLTSVMRCAINAKDENKKIGAVLNLFHEYTQALLYNFLMYS